MVVAFHVGIPGFSGGFVGVDVFFAISGYLITGLLTQELAASGTIAFPAFIARRVRRLLPAAAVVLCVTLAVSALAYPPLQLIRTALAARAAAAYAANIHFLRLASDYFSGDVRLNPTLHTWSLGVEEQFYLVWPLFVFAVARTKRGTLGFARRRLAWGLTALGMASFLGATWYVSRQPLAAFYAMPLRAWEFACGGLASLVVFQRDEDRSARATRIASSAIGWLGFALIVAAGVFFTSTTVFPGAAALVPVVGTSMLLIAGADPRLARRGTISAGLSAPPLRWIGRRSYSWYLWHWPALVLGVALFPSAGAATRIGLALFALLLADLTYRFVETPTRLPSGVLQSARVSWRTIGVGAAATAGLLVSIEVELHVANDASHGHLQRAITTAAEDRGVVYRDGCVNSLTDERVHVCRYGSPSAGTTIAVFGDSHAMQWLPALETVARTRGWAVLVVAKTRCATAEVPVYAPLSGRESEPCARWRRAAIDTLRARHPSVVVLSNAMVYIRWPMLPAEVPAVSAATWESGMRTTLESFRAARVPTLVIQDTPQLESTVLTCLARAGWVARQRGACGVVRSSAVSVEVAGVEARVVGAVPGSRLIDFTDVLCLPDACSPMVRGMVAYQDGEHLTATMTQSLAPMFVPALDSAVAERLSRGSGEVSSNRQASIR